MVIILSKGLYIHIPFCAQICHYCDFHKYVASTSLQEAYLLALLKELDYYRDDYHDLETIYIGGGTPSYLNLDLLEKLFSSIKKLINIAQILEYTIEANPKDITQAFVTSIQNAGINRISIGVQSFQNHLLDSIGRNHHREDVVTAITILNQAHFENISFDIIYAIPGQTLEDFQKDLDISLTLNPKHLSIYSLILEEKTVLYHQVKKQEVNLISEDLEIEMVEMMNELLERTDFKQYEISNYALPGYQSLHNRLYWDMETYRGIGLSAASFIGNQRFENITTLHKYIQSVNQNGHGILRIENAETMKEFIIMGLRKTKGISLSNFSQCFHSDLFIEYPILQKFIKLGILELSDDYLSFSKNGIYLSNQVFVEII